MDDWNNIIAGCINPQGIATLSCLPAVFQNIVNALLLFAGIVSFFLLMLAGIKLMLARGEAKQLEEARHTATYAIIGLILVLLSFMVLNLVAYFTGVDCIRFFGFENCK